MTYVLNLQKLSAFDDGLFGWSTVSEHCSSASNGCSGQSTVSLLSPCG